MSLMESPPARTLVAEERFVLYDVSWEFYEKFLAEMGSRRLFLTYDRGTLELMSPSITHGRSASLLGWAVLILTEELDIPIDVVGMATFRRQGIAKGLEPDDCFYIRNEALVREKDEIDLTVDPPPDLAIEVEVSRSSLNKLAVYAGLGFPEVWRYDGTSLSVHVLQPDGQYAIRETSLNFPFLPMGELPRFLNMAPTMDKTTWARTFRGWVRDEIAPRVREA